MPAERRSSCNVDQPALRAGGPCALLLVHVRVEVVWQVPSPRATGGFLMRRQVSGTAARLTVGLALMCLVLTACDAAGSDVVRFGARPTLTPTPSTVEEALVTAPASDAAVHPPVLVQEHSPAAATAVPTPLSVPVFESTPEPTATPTVTPEMPPPPGLPTPPAYTPVDGTPEPVVTPTPTPEISSPPGPPAAEDDALTCATPEPTATPTATPEIPSTAQPARRPDPSGLWAGCDT